MDAEKRKHLAISARMEGVAAGLRDYPKEKVSTLELFTLVNLAEIGMLSVWSGLDGESGEKASAQLDQFIDAIRRTVSDEGTENGVTKLMQSGAAITRGRYRKYLIDVTD